MTDLPSNLSAAISVFASTNVDDLVVLAAFFANPAAPRQSIVWGQLLGMGSLVLLALAAGLAAIVIPQGWAALLGVVPLGLGVRAFRQSAEADAPEARSAALPGRSLLLIVAGVTIANGGDNLGIYIPLFASDPSAISLYVAVFTVMTALWLAASWMLVHHPAIGRRIQALGQLGLPFVLVAVGLWILSGARVLL